MAKHIYTESEKLIKRVNQNLLNMERAGLLDNNEVANNLLINYSKIAGDNLFGRRRINGFNALSKEKQEKVVSLLKKFEETNYSSVGKIKVEKKKFTNLLVNRDIKKAESQSENPYNKAYVNFNKRYNLTDKQFMIFQKLLKHQKLVQKLSDKFGSDTIIRDIKNSINEEDFIENISKYSDISKSDIDQIQNILIPKKGGKKNKRKTK